MSPLTDDEIQELRIVVGKAVGSKGPYTWGIDDYKAVAEYFKAKGETNLTERLITWARGFAAEREIGFIEVTDLEKWLKEKGI